MRLLFGGEFSGRCRDAAAALGHDAWSCDVRPSETPGNHLQCSYFDMRVVRQHWDGAIYFPDCTFLTRSGGRWNVSEEWRQEAQLAALHHVKALWLMPIDRVAIENPIGRLSTLWREPDQVVQPWMFGDPEVKATCLWIRGWPPLVPTHRDAPDFFADLTPLERHARVHLEVPGPDRQKNRSRTMPGIAGAIAAQWFGDLRQLQAAE
jgi:hypothetical protein